MTVADRPLGYSLWLSGLLPNRLAGWELMALSHDRDELELRARSLRFVVERRRLVIIEGQEAPAWRPML
jgi:hypothetical protein